MIKRDNDKHGTSRLPKIFAIAAATVAVASSAIVGTVAAQTSQLFEDVPRGHYAYEAVEWAVENGITVGCGDGTNFCPERTLNRAEVVTFLKRYHDEFHGTVASGSGSSIDILEPDRVATLRGTGNELSSAVRLEEGRYRIDFEIEIDLGSRRLGDLSLIALGSSGGEEEIFEQLDLTVDEFEWSSRIFVGSTAELTPGRIWFEVDAIGGADWTITVTQL